MKMSAVAMLWTVSNKGVCRWSRMGRVGAWSRLSVGGGTNKSSDLIASSKSASFSVVKSFSVKMSSVSGRWTTPSSVSPSLFTAINNPIPLLLEYF